MKNLHSLTKQEKEQVSCYFGCFRKTIIIGNIICSKIDGDTKLINNFIAGFFMPAINMNLYDVWEIIRDNTKEKAPLESWNRMNVMWNKIKHRYDQKTTITLLYSLNEFEEIINYIKKNIIDNF